MNGWFSNDKVHGGIDLYEYKDDKMVVTINFKKDGTFSGYHRNNEHEGWISYKTQSEMDAIWDQHYLKSKCYKRK